MRWLTARGGDAVFDRNGVALAQGETAPVMRATWNELQQLDRVEFYAGKAQGGRGYGRLRLASGDARPSSPAPSSNPSSRPRGPHMIDDAREDFA